MNFLEFKPFFIICIVLQCTFSFFKDVPSDPQFSNDHYHNKINSSYSLDEIQLAKKISSGNLDIVFCVDNTGSMEFEVDIVKSNIKHILDQIKTLSLFSGKLKVGVIAYRDYDDSWLIKKQPLTDLLDPVYKTVNEMIASGGGDYPEAAAEGFFESVRMEWRNDASKMIIWVADAPPHPDSAFRRMWEPQIENLREMNIAVHSVLVRNSFETLNVMKTVSRRTGGLVITLTQSHKLVGIVLGLAEDALDRLRINSIVKELIENREKWLKEHFTDDERRLRALVDILNKQQVRTRRFKFLGDQDVQQEFKNVTVFDVRQAVMFLSQPFKKTPCKEYGIFCQLSAEEIPEIGLISNSTNFALPIKQARVLANVSLTFAEITLIQQYINEENTTITGTFSFPLPDGASVIRFLCKTNNNTIEGKVYDTEQARAIYRRAIRMGNSAYLLTQGADNIFTMEIGNMEPGKIVELEIVYVTKLKHINGDSFQLTIPSNLFPKYDLNPTLPDQELSIVKNYTTHFSLKRNEEEDWGHFHCLSSSGKICRENSYGELINEEFPFEKDYVISFIMEKAVEDTVIISKPLQESNSLESAVKFILHPKLERISPLSYLDRVHILIDTSSSLANNEVFRSVKKIAELLVWKLKSFGKLDITTFSSDHNLLFSTSDEPYFDRHKAVETIESIKAIGGSNIADMLPSLFCEGKTRVFLISDGNLARTEPLYKHFELMKKACDFRILPISVGYNQNHKFFSDLERITRNKFEPVYPGRGEEEEKVILQISRAFYPSLKVDTNFQSFTTLPDYFDGSAIEIEGFLNEKELELLNKGMLKMRVANDNQLTEEFVFTKMNKVILEKNTFHHIIARAEIQDLEFKELFMPSNIIKQKIINIGLKYNLTSKYTSYVVVEEEKIQAENEIVKEDSFAKPSEPESDGTEYVKRGHYEKVMKKSVDYVRVSESPRSVPYSFSPPSSSHFEKRKSPEIETMAGSVYSTYGHTSASLMSVSIWLLMAVLILLI